MRDSNRDGYYVNVYAGGECDIDPRVYGSWDTEDGALEEIAKRFRNGCESGVVYLVVGASVKEVRFLTRGMSDWKRYL